MTSLTRLGVDRPPGFGKYDVRAARRSHRKRRWANVGRCNDAAKGLWRQWLYRDGDTVMIEFKAECGHTVRAKDEDAGGPRQLLRIELEGDEPLVGLACCCPSTGRQYFIRVPPATKTCHQAAAWIAGFDDPKLYKPALET